MEQRHRFDNLVLALLIATTLSIPHSFAQQYPDVATKTLSVGRPEDELHALSLTRFHFSTLKAFHNALFRSEDFEAGINMKTEEARIMNAVLDAFLKVPSREEILLRALREHKAIRLKFTVRLATDRYQMVMHPRKELLYHFEPVMEPIDMSLDIRPLLDGPLAFEIALNREGERHLYDVNWAGQVSTDFLSRDDMLW